jgi:hypothetical protein
MLISELTVGNRAMPLPYSRGTELQIAQRMREIYVDAIEYDLA